MFKECSAVSLRYQKVYRNHWVCRGGHRGTGFPSDEKLRLETKYPDNSSVSFQVSFQNFILK